MTKLSKIESMENHQHRHINIGFHGNHKCRNQQFEPSLHKGLTTNTPTGQPIKASLSDEQMQQQLANYGPPIMFPIHQVITPKLHEYDLSS